MTGSSRNPRKPSDIRSINHVFINVQPQLPLSRRMSGQSRADITVKLSNPERNSIEVQLSRVSINEPVRIELEILVLPRLCFPIFFLHAEDASSAGSSRNLSSRGAHSCLSVV